MDQRVTEGRLEAMLELAAVAFQSDAPARGEALCLEVSRLAEHNAMREPQLRSEILRWMRLGPDRLADRDAIVERLMRLTEGEPALLPTRSFGMFLRCAQELEVGRLDAAIQTVRDFRALERRTQLRTEFPPVFDTMHAIMQGRWVEAEQHLGEALDMVRRQGMAQSRQLLMQGGLMFGLRHTQGRVAELLPVARPMAAWSPEPMGRITLAFVLAECGQQTEAREEFERIADVELTLDPNWLFCESLRGFTAARLGDRPRCSALYERLSPYADRLVLAAWMVASQGSAARLLALLAATLGDVAAARQHFESALAMNGRLGARPWVAYCQIEYAELLRETGETDRARELLQTGAATARELGIQSLVDRVAKLGEAT